MADKETVKEEFDDEGNLITPKDEGGTDKPPKIEKSDKEKDGEVESEPVIPIRQSALQHIVARKNKTIEKLRSKSDEDEEDAPLEDDEDEDDSLTPEARTAVGKEVERRIGPIVKTLASKADEDELAGLLVNEPESAKYEKRIRAYMNSPHYRGVPPSVIYHHLAFDDAETTGLRKKRAADTEAGQTRGAGTTRRPDDADTGDIPSIEEQNAMTDAEFEAVEQKARTGGFVKKEE